MTTACEEAKIKGRLSDIVKRIRILMKRKQENIVSDVDSQHEKLLEKFDKFAGALLFEHLDPHDIDSLVQTFVGYISIHFTIEETLMKIVEYDDTETHKRCHRLFLQDITRLLGLIPLGMKTNEDLAVMAGEWLLNHEGASDTYFARYVARFQ